MTPNTKVFNPGDAVLDGCQPFVIQVTDAERDFRCHFCFEKSTSLARCSQCHQVKYCSEVCRLADRDDIHKHECKLLKNARDYRYDQIERLFIRLVLKVTLKPQSRQRLCRLWADRQIRFDDLVSHEDKLDLKKLPAVVNLFRHATDQLDKMFGVKMTVDELTRLYGLIRVNSMKVVNPFSEEADNYAIGLYIESSSLEHDCKPSCFVWFNGRQMQVRAMRNIDLTVEEPTISYIDLRKNREFRRKKLSEKHFIECLCTRCVEQTDQEFDFDRYEDLLANPRELDIDYWEEVIGKERALVGNHFPSVTVALFKKFVAFDESFPYSERTSSEMEEWRRLADELKSEFLITHGEEHPDYHQMLESVRNSGRPLEDVMWVFSIGVIGGHIFSTASAYRIRYRSLQ